ncbi:DUF2163 domain-containing protein [Ehrlichia ruminantium]|uniref:DUF2163 domain-containing protein n=1 Tax=Ehrlichia ruminantium TaxID=779 RepID=A0AAE6UIC5_EHRRU|nr:DUF2163 domain-containing protein [Ehrlichia ruminantium]QGR02346.1 DUF2163 domain-containing protein [Ehrlichia ruminantium]QGR03265.1 DUF2163 domain-containing protein [Ehrlichia ruminantium]QGR04191.1 DUF2163 domain-containing protein [Ehrlichia ruminantium]
MKNISTKFKQHISSEILTLAYCIQLTLKNNKVIGLTDFDQDLVIDNITYKSAPGLNIDILKYNTTSGSSTKIETIIDGNTIKEEDILFGMYDFTTVKILLVNYTNIDEENLILFYGNTDKVTITNHKLIVELNSISHILLRNIGNFFSSSCRAQFCDAQCKLNKESFTNSHYITKVISKQEFECITLINTANYYTYGSITFTTGKNSNLTLEIKQHNKSYVQFYNSLPHNMNIDDKFFIIAGCDKSFNTCSHKFNNSKNFRGEPHIPELQIYTY